LDKTGEGINPAPVGKWFIPTKKKKTLFTMFHSYRLRLPTGAGFRNHPQYEAIAWKTASCEPSM
jgi:hypothetical protein